MSHAIVEYVPYGEVFIEERNNVWNTPYLFNAKEFDEETGLYYYGARYYDPKLAMWLGVDPLAEKYPNVGAYVYCANNPVKLVDPDGRIPRLYVEVQGVGHVFVTTGSGNNMTVYTYGRYAELGKNKESARSTSPTGEGVLVILKGKEVKQFVANQITEKDAAAFEFMDACDSKVDEFYMDKFSNSNKIPNVGKYKDSDNARVIDEYNLINNNCATTSVQSILYGGGDVSSIIGDNIPFLVAKNLHNEVANEQNPISHFLEIIFGDYKPHIRLVSSDEILKETKDE